MKRVSHALLLLVSSVSSSLGCGGPAARAPGDAAVTSPPDASVTPQSDAGDPALVVDAGPPRVDAGSLDSLSVPAPCMAGARPTLRCFADWRGTGLYTEVETPAGFDPTRDATVIFSHGANASPRGYDCYREVFAERGIRTVSPDLADDIRTGRAERWSAISAIYAATVAEQSPTHVFFSGHSFGAYTTLLAAGADSRVKTYDAGNCAGRVCTILPAAGYLPLSPQPAQSALDDPPDWFARDAFRALAPHRLILFGSDDHSPQDACLRTTTVSLCRADAATIANGAPEADASHQVVEGFDHNAFGCSTSWRSRSDAATLARVIDVMVDWILMHNGRAL